MENEHRYTDKNLDDYKIEWHDFGQGVKFPYVPDNVPWNIGVKMSGGIDSATILYVLAWLRDQEKLHKDTKFYAMTGVNWVRPYQTQFVNNTIDYVNNKFKCSIPYTSTLLGGDPEKGPDLEEATETCVDNAYINFKLHMFYTGRSKFLPVDYVDNTEYKDACCEGKHDPITKDMPYKIMLDLQHKDNTKYGWDDDMHSRQWEAEDRSVIHGSGAHPWINLHKGHVKVVTDALDITNDLLAITRSCEHFTSGKEQWMDWSFHCGECYWCVERLVTYGKLQ